MMAMRLTNFLRHQLDRAEPYADTDGGKLQRRVEETDNRACNGTVVDAFFPAADEYNREPSKLVEREKLAELCSGCPVADECLAGALLRGERYGGWGGVAQPDFQELSRVWHRLHPHNPSPHIDRQGCTATRHGTRSAYSDGCRCSDALAEHRAYNRWRSAKRKRVS